MVVAFKSSLLIFSFEPVVSHVQTSAGMVQKPVLQPGRLHSLRFKQFSHVFRVWLCQYQPAFKPEASGESLEGWTTGVRLEDFRPWWNVHNVTSSEDRILFSTNSKNLEGSIFSIGSGMLNAGVHPKSATTVASDQGLGWLFFMEPSRLNLFNLGGDSIESQGSGWNLLLEMWCQFAHYHLERSLQRIPHIFGRKLKCKDFKGPISVSILVLACVVWRWGDLPMPAISLRIRGLPLRPLRFKSNTFITVSAVLRHASNQSAGRPCSLFCRLFFVFFLLGRSFRKNELFIWIKWIYISICLQHHSIGAVLQFRMLAACCPNQTLPIYLGGPRDGSENGE